MDICTKECVYAYLWMGPLFGLAGPERRDLLDAVRRDGDRFGAGGTLRGDGVQSQEFPDGLPVRLPQLLLHLLLAQSRRNQTVTRRHRKPI